MRVSAASTAAGSARSLSFAACRRLRGRASSLATIDRVGCGIVVFGLVAGRIRDPAVDRGFVPSNAVNADLHLGRKGPFGDLAVDGRSRQSGAIENGSEADDPFGLGHTAVPSFGRWRGSPAPTVWLSPRGAQECRKSRLARPCGCLRSLAFGCVQWSTRCGGEKIVPG